MDIRLEEAIKRIETLGLKEEVSNALKSGEILISDDGLLLSLDADADAEDAVRIVKEKELFPYHIIKTYSDVGILYTVLYVSDNKEDWEYEKPNGKYVSSYCYNATAPVLSEFGDIFYKRAAEGLIRTA